MFFCASKSGTSQRSPDPLHISPMLGEIDLRAHYVPNRSKYVTHITFFEPFV
jgi:hypothetical protein